MALDAKVYALDIVNAISLIEDFTEGLTFETYSLDPLLTSAVERQLTIIGEAVAQVTKLQIGIALSSAKQIIGFRNILIHNYGRVSQEVVWTVVQDHLQTLKRECQVLLENEG